MTRAGAAILAAALPPDVTDLARHTERLVALIDAVVPTITDVLLVVDRATLPFVPAVGELLPGATVRAVVIGRTTPDERAAAGPDAVLVTVRNLEGIADRLRLLPQPQLVIDVARRARAGKVRGVRQVAITLRPGGLAVVADVGGRLPPRGADLFRDVEVLGTCVAGTKISQHMFTVRAEQADEVLDARYGDAWGRTLVLREPRRHEGGGELVSHGQGPFESGPLSTDVPEMRLHEYERPCCAARQVMWLEDHWLPETWRHAHRRRFYHRRLDSRFQGAQSVEVGFELEPPRELPGTYFYLDTECPGHFGHVTTEVLSRYWGWVEARKLYPDLRALISVRNSVQKVPAFQLEMFEALGIPTDTMVVIGPHEVVVPQRLLAATPALENPLSIDPEITQVWERLAAGLQAAAPLRVSDAAAPAPTVPPAEVGDRIFVSRRAGNKRECLDTPEIESFFRRRGFAVVYPEDYAYRDQAAIFAGARVVAGFAGSAMFSTMFAPHAKVVLIASDGYRAANEKLVATANGATIHYFWGTEEPQVREPGAPRSDVYSSSFRFPLKDHRWALRRALR